MEGVPEYQNIDYHNLKQEQIKRELDTIWNQVQNAPIQGFGFGLLNQQQPPEQ